MGKLNINNGGIDTNKVMPDIDERFGPYASIDAANTALGASGRNCITAGLTVGITQGDGSVKEYWYQPDGSSLTLVPKQRLSGTPVAGDFASFDANGDIVDSGHKHSDYASASQGTKADTAYQKPSGGIPATDLASAVQTSLGKADTAMQTLEVGTTTTGAAGTNASVSNSGTATNPVLNFTIPRGANGQDGADAVNPFKGWWPDLAKLKAVITAQPGDSAYVKDASPATTWSIYVYDETASSDNYWADSGTKADTSNVQTFASGQDVNDVGIDDTNLSDAVSSDEANSPILPKASDVQLLKQQLRGVTLQESKASFTMAAGYINESGVVTGSTANTHAIVTLISGFNRLRFVGLDVHANASSTLKKYSYAFYDSSNNLIPGSVRIYDHSNVADSNALAMEYVIDIPDNAAKFMCSIGGSNRPIFYCYFENGENVLDITSTINDRLKVKKNFNFSVTSEYFINYSTGQLGSGSSYAYTSFINIEGVSKITYAKAHLVYSATASAGLAFYSAASTSNYISGVMVAKDSSVLHYEEDVVSVPEGAKYVRFTLLSSNTEGFYAYPADVYFNFNSEFDTINNSIQYNENLPYTPVFGGGSIDYLTGGTIGTANSNSGWVNVEGLTSIRYSRFKMTSTNNKSGVAFYSEKSVSGYISGQRGITGASEGGYVDTFIDIPPTAKWARFSIWGTSVDNYSGFYVKNADIDYISYDKINNWINEGINNADLNVKVLKGKKISIIGDSISCFGTEAQTRTQGYNAPYWIVKTVDVGQQIQSYVTWLDVYNTINAGSTLTNKTIGGVTLTAAMIGTLQTFTPVAEDVGKEIGVARWASSYTTKPWWQVLIEKSGAELCNNASWSGSRIVEIPEGNSRHDAFVLSESYSEYTTNRVCNKDDEGNTIVPDVILIYRGVNDFVGVDPEGGTGTPDVEDLDTPNLITWDESNFDSHNFTEGYIHTILTLRRKYPNTYIILCTLNVIKRSTTTKFPTDNGTYTLPDYNNKIREIANIMGCGLIEFDKDGITYENCYPTYISDSASAPIHPNTNGHRVMGEKAFADVKYCLNLNN